MPSLRGVSRSPEYLLKINPMEPGSTNSLNWCERLAWAIKRSSLTVENRVFSHVVRNSAKQRDVGDVFSEGCHEVCLDNFYLGFKIL